MKPNANLKKKNSKTHHMSFELFLLFDPEPSMYIEHDNLVVKGLTPQVLSVG